MSWTTAFLSSKRTSSSGSANSSSSSDPSSSSSSLSSPSSSSPTTRFLFKVDEEDPLGLLTILILGFSSRDLTPTPSEDDCEDDEKITSDLEWDAILGSSSVNTECKIEESSTTLVDNKG